MMRLVSSPGYSQSEIQRQNRITQRIIANFLERKLFPYRRPQHEVPTIDEILPVPAKDPPRSKHGGEGGGGGVGGKRRFRPKTALELLHSTGKSGFRPSRPKYSALRASNLTDQSLLSGSDEDQDKIPIEDYYDDAEQGEEDYVDDGEVENPEDVANENEGENEGRNRRNNGTLEILLNVGRGDGAGGIGDYDDYGENNYETYETEGLQSVESEHLDLFYRNHFNNRDHSRRSNSQFFSDDDFSEGRCRKMQFKLES